MNYSTKAVELERRATAIDTEMRQLGESRKEFALGAIDGSKASIKAIQQIDCEMEAHRRELETVSAAIEQAERLHREQEAEIARRDFETRKAEAGKIIDALAASNAEIDAAMNGLQRMFERRARLIQQLAGTKAVSDHVILRLLQKFGGTCAARAAKLHDWIAIEHVPPNQVRPLAAITVPFRRAIIAADETEAA